MASTSHACLFCGLSPHLHNYALTPNDLSSLQLPAIKTLITAFGVSWDLTGGGLERKPCHTPGLSLLVCLQLGGCIGGGEHLAIQHLVLYHNHLSTPTPVHYPECRQKSGDKPGILQEAPPQNAWLISTCLHTIGMAEEVLGLSCDTATLRYWKMAPSHPECPCHCGEMSFSQGGGERDEAHWLHRAPFSTFLGGEELSYL